MKKVKCVTSRRHNNELTLFEFVSGTISGNNNRIKTNSLTAHHNVNYMLVVMRKMSNNFSKDRILNLFYLHNNVYFKL